MMFRGGVSDRDIINLKTLYVCMYILRMYTLFIVCMYALLGKNMILCQ